MVVDLVIYVICFVLAVVVIWKVVKVKGDRSRSAGCTTQQKFVQAIAGDWSFWERLKHDALRP